MSDDIEYINVDDERFQDAPRALREHVDKVQKALKAANQTITGFETERASSALSGVLTGFKNPERVKSALLTDKVDPLNSEAVSKWIEENGDDYARGESSAPVHTEPTAEEIAHKALNLGGAYRPAADMSKLEVVASQLPLDATPAQVAEALRAGGI